MVEQLPLEAPINDENRFYMQTKVDKMGHDLEVDPSESSGKSSDEAND